jgi:hypothetical protein
MKYFGHSILDNQSFDVLCFALWTRGFALWASLAATTQQVELRRDNSQGGQCSGFKVDGSQGNILTTDLQGG